MKNKIDSIAGHIQQSDDDVSEKSKDLNDIDDENDQKYNPYKYAPDHQRNQQLDFNTKGFNQFSEQQSHEYSDDNEQFNFKNKNYNQDDDFDKHWGLNEFNSFGRKQDD